MGLVPPDLISFLSALFRRQGVATMRAGCTLGLAFLDGDRGAWSVDLGVPGGAWKQGIDPDCAVQLAGTTEALLALVLDPESIPAWLSTGALRVQGDPKLFFAIAQLLDGGLSPLGVRLSRGRGGARS